MTTKEVIAHIDRVLDQVAAWDDVSIVMAAWNEPAHKRALARRMEMER